MGEAGSPYTRFRRALDTRNLHLVRTTAAELPAPLQLDDALRVLQLIAENEPERYRRAAARFAARAALEHAHLELCDLAVLVAVLHGPTRDLVERVNLTLRRAR